jgi:NhaA family Na+:H+ antiporter
VGLEGFIEGLFIGLLAFADDPLLQSEVKIGILAGSLLSGLAGLAVLRAAPPVAPSVGPAAGEGARRLHP